MNLTITGDDVDISETVGPGADALVFKLPVGQEHEVTIDTTNFIGRPSFVLPPGGAQIDVQILEKLFVPDQQSNVASPRLVRVNDMSGDGWLTNDTQFVGLNPIEATVGPDGRIYVLDEGGDYNIVVLDQLDTTTVAGQKDAGITWTPAGIAIDRNNNYLYVVGTDSDFLPALFRFVLTESTCTDLFSLVSDLVVDFGFIAEADLWGVAADDSGNVYVSGDYPTDFEGSAPFVRKIDPGSGTVLWTSM